MFRASSNRDHPNRSGRCSVFISGPVSALLVTVNSACSPPPTRLPPPEHEPTAARAPADAPEPTPDEARDEPSAAAAAADGAVQFVHLAVPGFAPAVLGLPASTEHSRPVLIAAHGAGDSPEWQCETWQKVVRGRSFILCPRGVRLGSDPGVPSGFFYRNHFELQKELFAAIDALEQAYPGAADTSAIVYTGYSQGATMGALVAMKHGRLFPRLALVEGGGHDWNRTAARMYARSGGLRVLLACGVNHCDAQAKRAARWLTMEHVAARAEYAAGAGHIYDGPVLERVADAFDWLTSGDPRWAGD
jgi:predicted esterase